MRNIVILLFVVLPLVFTPSGCTPKYGRHDPDRKQALRTLAGGVAGALLAGNTGGAIVGALVMDVVSVAAIRYEDTLLENGDQAAKRYKNLEQKAEEKKIQQQKAEEKREEEKKAEDRKEQERKAEERRDFERKAEEGKERERKAEKIKEREKKAEQRRLGEKKVRLIIEDSSVATLAVKSGATVKANVQYTLLGPEGTENVRITESRKIWTAHSTYELATRDIVRRQGTYRSSIQFTMPDDVPRGYCILYTTVSDGKQVKTARSVMNIL
jgi:hypothetical protein